MAAGKPDKKEKKEKKRSDDAGVSKPKKDKKEKKEKKEKLAAAREDQLQQDAAAQSKAPAVPVSAVNADDDSDMEEAKAVDVPLERAVVSFALPLADEKGTKKIYKTIRKGMCSRQEQYPQAWRQGGRQDAPKICSVGPRQHILPWRCHYCR
jgi:H/ACA ribonucleoprotein complex subunit 2